MDHSIEPRQVPPASGETPRTAPHSISFAEAFRVWLKIGLLSFGGPAGQIALMHRILVDEKRWIGESRFLHALNYCMLLPGPEAQQLAVYIGWLLHRTAGGLVAGILFVLPGALVILLLSVLYAGYQDLSLVQAIFFGVKAAVLAVVVEALLRISRRALKNGWMYVIAGAAFLGIFALDVDFPIIVLAAALVGLIGGRVWPHIFVVAQGHGGKAEAAPMLDAALADGVLDHTRPSLARAVRVLLVCLVLWFTPIVAAVVFLGWHSVYATEGLFFSKMAVVTFGGAYAVLAYVAQEAVNTHGWLQPGEMLDGLGLAETTPGPLILVLQFVGFMGAFRNPGGLDPMLAGVLGAALTTWVTFVPCFLWIFLGAPYIEALRGNKALAAALSTITAAVVGVMLNLAVWFGLHVLFGEVGRIDAAGFKLHWPVWQTLDPFALALSIAAIVAMLVYYLRMLTVLAASALIGAVIFYLRA
jgi:chromate transporter